MEVLAYLLGDRPPGEPGTGFHGTTRIILGNRTTDEGDEEHLQSFSAILRGLNRRETFGALHKSLPFHWYDGERYDTVNPFGDRRQTQYHAVWRFDTQKELLHYTNCHHHRVMALSLLRDRVVSIADMELVGRPVPNSLSLKPDPYPDEPYWVPEVNIDSRVRAFSHRLFRDFHFQWRHIIRNHFNCTTLRVLASAIIRIATLDFEIRENTGGYGPRGAHVWIMQLPPWDPLEADIKRVGNVNLVLCQDIEEGLSKARRHLSSQGINGTNSQEVADNARSQASYMILTVKHIMLCHTTGWASLANTAPQPLFNGDYDSGSPSELALDYLIWATASVRPLIFTPLQSLPPELQDMMLKYLAIGRVGSAKFGCLLGIGAPFSWRSGPENVTLMTRNVIRPQGWSVESQIWFGEHESGVVYQLIGPG